MNRIKYFHGTPYLKMKDLGMYTHFRVKDFTGSILEKLNGYSQPDSYEYQVIEYFVNDEVFCISQIDRLPFTKNKKIPIIKLMEFELGL